MSKKSKINSITHTSNIVGNILTSKITHKDNVRRVNNFVFPKKRKG